MKRKIQLSGIIDSYEVTRNREHSLFIPALIALVVVGMLVFFFEGKDKPGSKSRGETNPEQFSLREELPLLDPEPVAEAPPVPSKPDPTVEIPRAVLVEDSTINGEFTDWMAIHDLDAVIKSMNVGHEKTFWERGHWITAAEGRWHLGDHQFRIVWEKVPDEKKLYWQYRLNQSQEEFTQSVDTFLNQGYKLVYSQSFQRPDHTLRFQGIWQKPIDASLQSSEDLPISRSSIKAPQTKKAPTGRLRETSVSFHRETV